MASQWDDDSAEGSLWSRSFDFDDCNGGVDCEKKTLSLLVEEVRLISVSIERRSSFFFVWRLRLFLPYFSSSQPPSSSC